LKSMTSDNKITQHFRFHIVGSCGSGKSSLAEAIAKKLDIPHIQLDAFHHTDNWGVNSDEKFFELLLKNDLDGSWVADGNYSKSWDTLWKDREVTVIWIDLPFSTTFSQLLQRTFRRISNNEKLWGTSLTESISKTFCSKDSIILWLITTYHKNKKKFSDLINSSKYECVNFVHLRSRSEISHFLQNLGL